MAICSNSLLYGYPLQCRDNSGGIQSVYIGAFDRSNPMTWNLAGVSGASASYINAFTGATVSHFNFQMPLNTADWTTAGAFSTENGTSVYKSTVNITLQKLTDISLNLTNILGQGAWRLLILDQNGNYFLVGAQNGARVSAATPGTGKALGDLNGAIITFEAEEPLAAYQVSTAAALSVISN